LGRKEEKRRDDPPLIISRSIHACTIYLSNPFIFPLSTPYEALVSKALGKAYLHVPDILLTIVSVSRPISAIGTASTLFSLTVNPTSATNVTIAAETHFFYESTALRYMAENKTSSTEKRAFKKKQP
jgi:hypothetical protein